MMTAPYMPIAMCISTGGVPQWYMKIPAWFAVNVYVCDLPASIGTIAVLGETMPAWKSSEWVIVPSLTIVKLNVSPIFPR